jgi:hypothetical protein
LPLHKQLRKPRDSHTLDKHDVITAGHQELVMPFKPNYRFERFERERLKKAKKEEKLRRQQERVSQSGEAAGSTATEGAPPES